MSSAVPTQPDRKKPEQPVWPTYSWRSKSLRTQLLYITDSDKANHAVESLTRGPLGFDLEWRPNYVKGQMANPVALVQLSNIDTILLIQISKMKKFPEKLRELLEDCDIVKAGVGIQGDCKKLHADWNVSARNCVDLSLLARCVDNARWKGRYSDPIGLARLVEAYEKLSLPKGRIQRSDWEAQLSTLQQDYAANDAHSGLIIYTRFAEMAKIMPSVPKHIYYTFDAIEGKLLQPSSTETWAPSNPEYDPGPPPPPRPPRPPREPNAAFLTSNENEGDSQMGRPPRRNVASSSREINNRQAEVSGDRNHNASLNNGPIGGTREPAKKPYRPRRSGRNWQQPDHATNSTT